METRKAIFSRRSIRKYINKAVDKEILLELVRAGMYAPSARNKQPWQFIIIDNKDVLNGLATAHPYGKMLEGATAAILVCGDKKIEETESYLLQNCSAATQNILLMAHDLGLGAVWLGLHPREERITAIKNVLGLPSHLFPVSLISIGYPDEKKTDTGRFLPERIHFNGYLV